MKRKDEKEMKQVIVMVAMIALGIALAMMVLSFKQPAETITDTAVTSITKTLGKDAVNGD